MSARLSSLLPGTLLLAACVAYEGDDASPQRIHDELAERAGGNFSFADAASLALRQNPELRAAEARARAAGAAATVPLPVVGEWRGRNEAVGAMLDPIALLGLGPRGAAMQAADAQAAQAATALAVARWRTLAELAEVFRLHRVAEELRPPGLGALDADAYEQAGLASEVAAAMLRAADARARSEQVELDRLRDDQVARLRHLLGLPDGAVVELVHEADPVGPIDGELPELLSRPDVTLAAARFEVADREFRRAVAAQYPSFQLGPNVSLRGDPLRAMAMLNVPLGMQGLAEAARERREAARHDIEDVLLEAQREAQVADAARLAALATDETAQAMLAARRAAFVAASAAVEVEPDAFQRYAGAAGEYAKAAADRRRAAAALAVADVRHAVAYGWPQPSNEEENR